jgi:hypothetical protein
MTIRKTGAVTGRVLGVEQNPEQEPEGAESQPWPEEPDTTGAFPGLTADEDDD